MNTSAEIFGKRRIVVVSCFSGMDLFLLALIKSGFLGGFGCERNKWACEMHRANFFNLNGQPLIDYLEISKTEYDFMWMHKDEKDRFDLRETIFKKDGRHFRTKSIQDVDGRVVRQQIETMYGADCFIILIGGPPCQDFTTLNSNPNLSLTSRNFLIFEFARLLSELNPDVAFMEEVHELNLLKHKRIKDAFIKAVNLLPYYWAEQKMNSLHYGSNQSRVRLICYMIHKKWKRDPIFPIPDVVNCRRICDFLDVDYVFSGHYIDKFKSKNSFMPTVTSGSPTEFIKDDVSREPTIDELLLCMDVLKGEYLIPTGIPKQQIRKAIGNGVTIALGKALAKTLIDLFGIRPIDNGYWTDADSSGTPPEKNSNTPTTPAPITPTVTALHPVIPTSNNKSPRIISSIRLLSIPFNVLPFAGDWFNFMGQPSTNFHVLIHGLAGHGKSTLAVMLAKYLGENFGRVLYVSGEEGFSLTLQLKFFQTDASHPNIDVANLKTTDEVLQFLHPDKYRFIFLDSLNTMQIDVFALRRLKAAFPRAAFITIAQSTKAGQMRGSYELVHDADVSVKVADGTAIIEKNRFGPVGRTFLVFEKVAPSKADDISQQDNTSITQIDFLGQLEKKLADAVKREDYELAAKLRDEINRLKSGD